MGTITDLDGNFTLNVPDGKEVEISYIDMYTTFFRSIQIDKDHPEGRCAAIG